MRGPNRKQRKPTEARLSGLDNKSVTELKAKEEQNYKVGKVPHYIKKKRVILLTGEVIKEEK